MRWLTDIEAVRQWHRKTNKQLYKQTYRQTVTQQTTNWSHKQTYKPTIIKTKQHMDRHDRYTLTYIQTDKFDKRGHTDRETDRQKHMRWLTDIEVDGQWHRKTNRQFYK